MPQQTSRSNAQPAERPVLAPSWLIALLASLVGTGLWLLYPQQDLARRLAESTASKDVALSVVYLRNLLRSDPGNAQLLLLLARQHMQLGEYPQARSTLQPLENAADPSTRREYAWLLWQMDYAQYNALPADARQERTRQRAALREHLRALDAYQWPPEQARRIGQWGAQLQEPGLSISEYRELAALQTDRDEAARLYEQAARAALGQSDYDTCAQLYLLARRATTAPGQAKAYFLAALAALQSGNRPAEALALGEREIGPLIDDKDVLLRLTELARAANRPDQAERYVRRLLRLSLRQPLPVPPRDGAQAVAYDDGARWLQPMRLPALQPGAWGLQRTAASATPARHPALLPFDDTIYTLAYQVFLENRNQKDALLVARSAVRQQPGSLVWRERLAQVAEWSDRPDAALEQWLYIAQHTQRDDAWQAVLRIAPGQFDDRALAQALRYQLRAQPGNMNLVRELVQSYERQGDPQSAIDYLQTHAQDAQPLELLAQLAERAGQPDLALATWHKVFAHPGMLTPQNAMQAAVLALTLNQPQAGLAWLEAAQHLPMDEAQATDFWRMTGQAADNQQRDRLALQAYEQLVALPQADESDFDTLARLLRDEQPLEAARINELAWQRLAQPRHLVEALTIYIGRSRWADAARLIHTVEQPAPERQQVLAQLLRQPSYLRLAGTYYQNQGDVVRARACFQAGLQQAPDSADMRSALIWLLIDSNDAQALRELLASHESSWSRDTALHDALAAAYQALSLPQTALTRYLAPRLAQHENDFLWLMNYADALDQNQQVDRAWRLRRRLLLQQRATSGARTPQQWLGDADLDATRRIARARLVLTQRPGDPALDVLRELLRLDRDARAGLSNAAAETAIGWLQDAGEYGAERGFLWQQYARAHGLRSNRPLWADITVALAEDDKASTGQLLQTFDQRLPRYDRVNAARAVDDLRLAQSAAFEAMEHQHDDQPLQQQLSESLLAFSDHAQVQASATRMSGMHEQAVAEAAHVAISPRLSLDVSHERIRRRAEGADTVVAPPQERALQAQLRWRHPDGETSLALARRESLSGYTPLELAHEQRIDNRLSARLALGLNQPTQESLLLRIAGMKDGASGQLRYQFTRQDTVTATLAGERYQLQTGGALGSARHATLYYTHAYRQDAPQLDLSAFWSRHLYQRRDLNALAGSDLDFYRLLPANALPPSADLFLPDGFSFAGVQLATNTRYESEYTRKLRPYAAISGTWHSRNGAGYGLRLGLAGSVLGADHLSISWNLDKSGLNNTGRTSEFVLSYRLHF